MDGKMSSRKVPSRSSTSNRPPSAQTHEAGKRPTSGSNGVNNGGGGPRPHQDEDSRRSNNSNASRLSNITMRDRSRDHIYTMNHEPMSPGFRNSSSIPLDLNFMGASGSGSSEETSPPSRGVDFKPPRSPYSKPSVNQQGLLPNQQLLASASGRNGNTTNYAFKKSVTMGNIVKVQQQEDSFLDNNNPSFTNNNLNGTGFGSMNNNISGLSFGGTSVFDHSDSKNSSVSSSVAGFALGGFKTPSYFSKLGQTTSPSAESSKTARDIACLHKSITSQDLKDRELSQALSFLGNQPEGKNLQNETRLVEKLKIHLITQGRHEEARRFIELHQQLKGMPLLKNREAVIGLMYELFDKEATRAALQAKRAKQVRETSASRPQSQGHHVKERPNQAPEEHRQRRPKTVDDATAIPNLNYGSDRQLHEEIHRSQNRVPSLALSQIPQERPSSKGGNQMEDVLYTSTAKIISFPKDHKRNLLSDSNLSNSSRSNTAIISESSSSLFGRGAQASLSFANMKSMEQELVKDLVFIFQGIDGNFVRSNPKGEYEISSHKAVHPSLRIQTLRLAELGYFYKQIRQYCDKPLLGLMAQGFKHALEKELQEYYRLLAIVQSQIQENTVDTPLSDEAPNKSGEDMTILKLTVWMMDCRPRLEVLAGMIDACDGKIGGELCSVLYKYSLHGDPMICSVTNSLLSTVAKPMYLMLCQWVLYGELEDPYGEFFIAADITCKKEQLWHSKYHIRSDMLPSFITLKQAERILATGKNINFLKEICQHTKGYEGRNQIKSWLERSPVECLFTEDEKVLNTAIERAYKTTSEMVLNVLIQESKLIDHLKAIKHYLLLGQGDFIQHLLELIQDELQKPATKLYTHNISAILESAVRATNAQFEPEDILCRLDTRILQCSDKDVGWDVFCLDYKVHGPIGTVLTDDVMIRYNRMFNALWRTKRIEMILSTLWKDQTALFKCQRFIPELGPVLHRSQLLISEMIHFVHQTQYYIMFEATECAWDHLMAEVSKASDLDEVIKAHSKFLKTITSRSLLDSENRELLNQLRGIFDTVHELKSFLVDFDGRVAVELQYRKGLIPNSNEQEEAKKQFFAKYIKQAKGKIETLYTTTQDLVRSFLLVLNRQADLTLQCLSFRLDFNEYYQFKDSRLSQPLTFQHRRLSSNVFEPINMSHSMAALSHSLLSSMSISEANGVED